MAEMETVISPELAEILEKNRSALNAAFEYYSSGDTLIDQADILNAFTRVINPIYDSGGALQDKIILSVFISLLKLFSKRLIGHSGRHKELEENFYTITGSRRKLLTEYGGTFLIYIFNALLNLNLKKISSETRWVTLISALPGEMEMDSFLRTGFVTAWRCGAASARENAVLMIPSLDFEIVNKIFDIESSDIRVRDTLSETISKNPWRDPASIINGENEKPVEFRTAGGFRGFGGAFRSLPVVCCIENYIYASDGTEVFQLFADYYGIELVREHVITPENVFEKASVIKNISDGKINLSGAGHTLPAGWKSGITSTAVDGNTIVWTVKDSYKLYIAGINADTGAFSSHSFRTPVNSPGEKTASEKNSEFRDATLSIDNIYGGTSSK